MNGVISIQVLLLRGVEGVEWIAMRMAGGGEFVVVSLVQIVFASLCKFLVC